MPKPPDHCAHCDVAIVDPTTSVDHGGAIYCCANCAAMMEQQGSGSDPQTFDRPNDLRCAHCACAIVDESTMETHGDRAYCCANCARAMEAAPRAGASTTTG